MRGEHLIVSIIEQIKDLRNDQSFNETYETAKRFCTANQIDLVQQLVNEKYYHHQLIIKIIFIFH